MHTRSLRIIDPRTRTMPGRSTLSFHRPGRHSAHQARSAVRCSESGVKDESCILPRKGRSSQVTVRHSPFQRFKAVRASDQRDYPVCFDLKPQARHFCHRAARCRVNACTTGNPCFEGQKFLGLSIGRGMGTQKRG